MRTLVLFLVMTASLLAADMGTLSFYLLKDGKPMASQELVVYKKSATVDVAGNPMYEKFDAFVTDEDGYLGKDMPVGEYQIQVVAKDKGIVDAFVKKNFKLKRDKETQLIVSLREDDSVAFEDSEAAGEQAVAVVKEEKKVKINGSVLLSLVSSENDKAVDGARIFVQGTGVDIKSKKDGSVNLELPEGEYMVSIIHSNFSTQTIKIKVLPKELITKHIELSPASMEMEEFVVLVPHVGGSISSIINEKRNSAKVEDIIGSDQMSKSGDSNAASALKRLSGVTIVDGSIFVRGLGERYTTASLNGLGLPSPEPTKRIVPLSLFPAAIIDSISVQKTYSADMPAQFGGGAIDIRTKHIPDDFFMNVKVETTYNDNYTGDDGHGYSGGDSDWTGWDDDTRELKDIVKHANPADLNGQPGIKNRELSDTLALHSLRTNNKTVPLSGKVGMSIGDNYKGVGYETGYTASYTYENKWDKIDRERAQYNASNGVLGTKRTSAESETTRNTINHSAMIAFGLDIEDAHTIKSTTFYAKNTTDITKLTDKVTENDDKQKSTYLSWVERDLLLTQLEGEHRSAYTSFGKFSFNWSGDWAKAERYEPATRDYTYQYSDANEQWQLNNNGSQLDYEYKYNKLNDDVYNVKTSGKHELEFDNGIETSLEVGYYRYDKQRDSETFRYSYNGNRTFLLDGDQMAQGIDQVISHPNIADYKLSISKVTNPASPDNYEAEHKIDATYISTDVQLTEELSFNAGIRRENSTQTTTTFSGRVEEENQLKSDDNFPALNATYKFYDGMQLRAGYGRSISRPDFREFIPSSYYDDSLDMVVQGNPDLTYAIIDSYDLRYEWYFSPTEMISFGAFFKKIDDPIETTLVSSAEGEVFTYINAKKADLKGVELDFRKNFAFITPALRDFFLGGNITLIDSEVELNDEEVENGFLTTNNRSMQGQSDYIVNIQAGYDNSDIGRSVTFLYNRADERIRALGTSKQPDIYEEPFDQLDFVWIEELIYGASMKFRVKNILDDTVLWTQGGKEVNKYKTGRAYTFALSWKY